MTSPFDLIIIGAGSGNIIIGPEMDDWKIALVERGSFGGTCLNRGCIPSKMFVYAADVAETIRTSARYGVRGSFEGADWPAIVDRVFTRVDPIAESGRQYRHSNHNVTVYEDSARFVGERTLDVGGERIKGDQIVIAAGARTFIPDIPGLADVHFETSDSIMRIERQPQHLVIIGGGFIAAELGHVFQALGSRVTIINRSGRLLMAEDDDVSARFTAVAAERFELVLDAHVEEVRRRPDGDIAVRVTSDGAERTVVGDALLIAAGRRPNSDQLDVNAAGVVVDEEGYVRVDDHGRTSAPGIWALGDIDGRHQLKHMANGEAKVVRHNLTHPDDLRSFDARPAPHAVFTSPQIGSVGITQRHAEETGLDVCVVTRPYSATAYGWAMEDHVGFVKLIGDPRTGKLLGAHVIGHEAALLVQLLVQGMHLGSTIEEMVAQVWIHPAMAEVVEQALVQLHDDIERHLATDQAMHPS